MAQKQQHKHNITKGLPKEFREMADSAIDHIGKIIDNADVQKVLDVAIYAGLAELGLTRLPESLPWEVRALWGPVALKLATTTTSGGGDVGFTIAGTGIKIPANSQTAGLSMLAVLGFASLPWGDLGKKFEAEIKTTHDAFAGADALDSLPLTPEERTTLFNLRGLLASATLGTEEDLRNAQNRLNEFVQVMLEKYRTNGVGSISGVIPGTAIGSETMFGVPVTPSHGGAK